MLFREEELDKLFNDVPKPQYPGWWPKEEPPKPKGGIFLKSFIAVIFGFVIGIIVIFGPNILMNFKWWYNTEYLNKNWSQQKETKASSADKLIISKIGVSAPLTWDVTDSQLEATLKNGVSSLAQNVRPAQNKPITIIGKSSNYWWDVNYYNNVFSLLPKLVVGDRIEIIYQGDKYTYVVSKIINKNTSSIKLINNNALVLKTLYPNITKNTDFTIVAYMESPDDLLYFSE